MRTQVVMAFQHVGWSRIEVVPGSTTRRRAAEARGQSQRFQQTGGEWKEMRQEVGTGEECVQMEVNLDLEDADRAL